MKKAIKRYFEIKLRKHIVFALLKSSTNGYVISQSEDIYNYIKGGFPEAESISEQDKELVR